MRWGLEVYGCIGARLKVFEGSIWGFWGVVKGG